MNKFFNWTIINVGPDNARTKLNSLKKLLKAYGNKHVDDIHVVGNGSKYLHVYTTPPALTVRISDHPTGAEHATNVDSHEELIAEVIKAYSKIK